MSVVQHINPDGMMKSPAFTQVISVPAGARTIYVGGQNAVDANGAVVGAGDLGQQSAKAIANVRTALQAAGADLEHLVKCTIYLVQGQSVQPGFQAWQQAWGARPNPPTVTVVFVAALGNPAFLIEFEAVAAVPGA